MEAYRRLAFAVVLLVAITIWSRSTNAQYTWQHAGCESGWSGATSNTYCGSGKQGAIDDCEAFAKGSSGCGARCGSCELGSQAGFSCGWTASAAQPCNPQGGYLQDWELDCDCDECSHSGEPCNSTDDCCGFTDGDLVCNGPGGYCVYEIK